jgi:hypothetical protein
MSFVQGVRLLRALVLLVIGLFVTALPHTASAQQERRVALVVGNSDYRHVSKLPNAGNDGRAMSAKLRQLGFTVVERLNATRQDFSRGMNEFSALVQNADAALVFFAGHAVQKEGLNYLLPVDAQIESELDIELNAIPINVLMNALARAPGAKMLMLDACRDDPLAERLQAGGASSSAGLARMNARGMLIAYATQSDKVAFDGNGTNSWFTNAFLEHAGEPGLDVDTMFSRVRRTVGERTRGKQVPEISSSLDREFQFVRQEAPDRVFARALQSGSVAELQKFVETYPNNPLTGFARQQIEQLSRQQTALMQQREAEQRARNLQQLAAPEYERLKVSRDPVALRDFATRFAETTQARDARARAEMLEQAANLFETIRQSNNPQEFTEFARRFPDTAQTEPARQRAAALQEEIMRRAMVLRQQREETERQRRAEEERRQAAVREAAAAYERARNANTPEALVEFIDRYPDSPDVAQARARAAQLEAASVTFAGLQSSADPKEFAAFVQRFPDMPQTAEARRRGERLQQAQTAFQRLRGAGGERELTEFARNFNDTPLADEARLRIAALQEASRQRDEEQRQARAREMASAFERLANSTSIANLKAFQSRFPESPQVAEIGQRIAMLEKAGGEWAKLRTSTDPEALEAFARSFPDSPQSQAALTAAGQAREAVRRAEAQRQQQAAAQAERARKADEERVAREQAAETQRQQQAAAQAERARKAEEERVAREQAAETQRQQQAAAQAERARKADEERVAREQAAEARRQQQAARSEPLVMNAPVSPAVPPAGGDLPAVAPASPEATPASLTPPVPAEPKPRTRAEERAMLIELQNELRRVGCYAGPANGVRNQATLAAIDEFRQRLGEPRRLGRARNINPADEELLRQLKEQTGRVCPEKPAVARRPAQEEDDDEEDDVPAARPVRPAPRAAPPRESTPRPRPAAPREAAPRPAPRPPVAAAPPAAEPRRRPAGMIGLGL